MNEKLEQIRKEAIKQIENSDALEKLNEIRVNFLGKKGELTAVLKSMKDVAPEDRPKVGQLVNETRAEIEKVLEEAIKKMENLKREAQMKAEVIDVTLPAKKNAVGHSHPNVIAMEEVQRIFIALDATDEIVDEAVRVDADMLLTHHPLIFKGIKNVSDSDFIGRRILRLIRYDISYYAMHTNFDVMGMADAAADEMKLEHREVLDVTYEDDLSREGIGRIGDLPSKMSLIECARYVKECFHIGNVRMYGDPAKKIKRVAICPGSGSDVIQNAIDKKVDVLITGDIGHHDGIDAVACGLPVITDLRKYLYLT